MFWSSSTSRTWSGQMTARSDDIGLPGRVHEVPRRRPGGASGAVDGGSHGSVTTKRAPRSAGARATSVPPWASTMPLAIDSPRPAPATSAVPRTRGSKIRLGDDGGMPGPWSRHLDLDGARRSARGAGVTSMPSRGRPVGDGVLEQVDEHLLQAVVVGPHRLEVGVGADADRRRRRPRSARGGLDDQPRGRTSGAAGAGRPTRSRSSRAGRRRAAPGGPPRWRSTAGTGRSRRRPRSGRAGAASRRSPGWR